MKRREATPQQPNNPLDLPRMADRSFFVWGIAIVYAAAALLLVAGVDAVLPLVGDKIDPIARQFAALFVKAAIVGALGLVGLLYGVRHYARSAALQQSLDEARALTETILNSVEEGVLVSDRRLTGHPIVYANQAFERITGYRADEAVGKNCRYLQGADRLQAEISQIRAALESQGTARVTLRNYRKDGSLFWNELTLSPAYGEPGTATHFVGVIRDVTELRDTKSRLEQAGHIDRLTSVANRSFFYDKVAGLLNSAAVAYVVIAKIDIARFHEINIGYGYDVGDLLLKQVAERLTGLDDGFVGRLAADEFALAVGLRTVDEADGVIARLSRTLQPKFLLPGATIDVRIAVGFALGAHGNDPMTLIRQAGVALQESKRSRLREVHGFDARTDAGIKSRMRLTHELHRAVASDDFVLYYQPKVELGSGVIVGAEALVRWVHPIFGLQPPSRFIPIAEETGMILEIGSWVLREAARFAVRVNHGRSRPVTISVNVSQVQFTHRNICDLVGHILAETGADPAWLILELTESLFADGSPETVARFRQLRAMGLGLSIDDFGTGYSSLRYLERFPISEVKLDKSFVEDLHESRVKQAIVDAVIRLGIELNIAVTAEGIETEAERAMLQSFHCAFGQGYLFGRPVEADEMLASLAHDRPVITTPHS